MSAFHFSEKREKKIIRAIRKAEKRSSGEIRVHISFRHEDHPYEAAVTVFHTLKMDRTALRNGVLFYVGAKDRTFVIIGGKGIDSVVPKDFWMEIQKTVLKNFKNKKYVRGLRQGIRMAGEALQKYFPYQDDDINELPDEISRD